MTSSTLDDLRRDIGRLKKQQGVEVYQPDREKEVLAHVRSVAAEGPLGPEAIARLFERIIDEARRLERRVVHDGVDPLEHREKASEAGRDVSAGHIGGGEST